MLRITVFAVATLALAVVSRRSLRSFSSHGFYRFLAWEAILGLVLVNFRGFSAWFGDPLAPRQVASWILLAASLAVVVPGVHGLRTRGRPVKVDERAELLALERTTELVTTGVFAYIRHPLYASLLFLAWGVFFKRPGVAAGVLALTATAFLFATARVEEAEDLRYYGERYREYMARTKRFVPFLL